MHRIVATFAIVCTLTLTAFPAAAFADTSFAQLLSQLEQQYQLPTGILWKVALAENSGKSAGCSPTSTACGMFQFTKPTWESATKAMYRQPLDLFQRDNPSVSAKVAAYELATIKWQVGSIITQAKVNLSAGLYLGHFLGSGGAKILLNAFIQNPNQSACSLLPKACGSNRKILSGSVVEVINWASNKMKVAGAPNVPGNFADTHGISYAYSSADINASDFLPATTVIPPNPDGQDATIFPTSVFSPTTMPNLLATTLPTSPVTLPSITATPQPMTGTSGATKNGSACTPQYSCSNNTISYQSESCATSVFQTCMYGCQGTVCAPPPSDASSTASLYSQSINTGGSTNFVPFSTGSVASPLLIASNVSSTSFSSLLSSAINTIIAGADQSTSGLSASSSASFNGEIAYSQDTLTEAAPGPSNQQTPSPIFAILSELRTALNGLLSYFGSL